MNEFQTPEGQPEGRSERPAQDTPNSELHWEHEDEPDLRTIRPPGRTIRRTSSGKGFVLAGFTLAMAIVAIGLWFLTKDPPSAADKVNLRNWAILLVILGLVGVGSTLFFKHKNRLVKNGMKTLSGLAILALIVFAGLFAFGAVNHHKVLEAKRARANQPQITAQAPTLTTVEQAPVAMYEYRGGRALQSTTPETQKTVEESRSAPPSSSDKPAADTKTTTATTTDNSTTTTNTSTNNNSGTVAAEKNKQPAADNPPNKTPSVDPVTVNPTLALDLPGGTLFATARRDGDGLVVKPVAQKRYRFIITDFYGKTWCGYVGGSSTTRADNATDVVPSGPFYLKLTDETTGTCLTALIPAKKQQGS